MIVVISADVGECLRSEYALGTEVKVESWRAGKGAE